MSQTELYQSVRKLSNIPTEYLSQVNDFLAQLDQPSSTHTDNREKTLALAGSWKDLSEEDFLDYLNCARESGNEAFNRETDL